MYKYLLWDIDGTILDFLAAEEFAIKKLFIEYGFGECSDEMLQTYSKINVKYWQSLERNEMTKDEILVGRFKEFFEISGIDATRAECFNKDYQLTLGDCITFVDGAMEELQREKKQYILAAVTNGTKVAQRKKLKESGLDEIFDKVFISEDVGIEKPNVEFFDHVFVEMKITDKSQVMIVGDSLTSDMLGGINAGIDTCWFNPKHEENNKKIQITYEIDDFNKLKDILES